MNRHKKKVLGLAKEHGFAVTEHLEHEKRKEYVIWRYIVEVGPIQGEYFTASCDDAYKYSYKEIVKILPPALAPRFTRVYDPSPENS